MTDLKTGDIKRLLKELEEESCSSDKIGSILDSFLVFSSKNKDFANEILANKGVEVLVRIHNNEKRKAFRNQIVNIFVSLSFEGNGSNEIAIVALSNINTKSDPNVLLQCMAGMKDILRPPSNSASSPASLPLLSLSITSCTAVLENTITLLASSSSAVGERDKQDVLGSLLGLVDAGVMNEAAEFAVWRQSQPSEAAEEESEAGGGGGSGKGMVRKDGGGESSIAAVRFTKTFAAFADILKVISLNKPRSILTFAAERMYLTIQQNKFFPTFVTLTSEKQEAVNLPLRFLANTAVSHVTVSGSKLSPKSDGNATFFVDPEINKGLYKIVIECQGNPSHTNFYILFGLAVKSLLGSLANKNLEGQASGTCSLYQSSIYCGNTAVVSQDFYNKKSNVTLGLELDADKHVLYFFLNDVQLPHSITNIPPSVHFGVTMYRPPDIVELKSFTKLVKPTINPSLICTQYGWK